ncbi:MAG: hypothetical protein JWM16_6275 [Verrucomicrobiales bacterium]|nr:hypothetical protein [Verrucomicrobiales bacterium]
MLSVEGKDAFMETRYIPEDRTETQTTRQELDLSWTESEWFQTWLRLAREKHQDQTVTDGN